MTVTPPSLRLAFMGTPDFALPTLDALAAAGHHIAAVYCQPPRPAGRGQQERLVPVHARAVDLGLTVRTPTSLKTAAAKAAFAALDPDAAVVVAYGLILPPAILAAPRLGCLNVHASLLPRWRGAAPIQRAIAAGDDETGVSLMVMEAGLDTGPVLCKQWVALDDTVTGGALHHQLAALGGAMIVGGLADWAAGRLTAEPQDDSAATYAGKLTRAEGRIDWHQPAAELARAVRAFDPWPGCWCQDGDTRLAVKAATVSYGPSATADVAPGTVLDDQLTVACGAGALRLTVLQRPGKGPMGAADFLRGYPLAAGHRLS